MIGLENETRPTAGSEYRLCDKLGICSNNLLIKSPSIPRVLMMVWSADEGSIEQAEMFW